MEALLVLKDGAVFRGRSFGAPGETVGEVVFNTGMTGYQEVITDPSYRGQMVVMTYPHIGNTGINDQDIESSLPHLRALIVRDVSERESNWRAKRTLAQYLNDHGIMALTGIDTRALTRHIRRHGALPGAISTTDLDPASLHEKARSAPSTSDQDLVGQVTCTAPYQWTEPLDKEWLPGQERPHRSLDLHVVAYDCGIKHNILRQLASSGCRVTVVPAGTPAAEVLSAQPDGVFLSNGPGDPENVPDTIANVRALIGQVPIFGICLGHQLLALASGARIFKLKFGHHGSNHPVKDLATSKIAITTQNHNFAVDPDSIGDQLELTHINLYDQTVEGFRHRHHPVFSVQYHPEAAPGPHDANGLFDQFIETMRQSTKG